MTQRRNFLSPEEERKYYEEKYIREKHLAEQNDQIVSLENAKNEIQQSTDLTDNVKNEIVQLLDKVINTIGGKIFEPLSETEQKHLKEILDSQNISQETKLKLTEMHYEYSTKKENNRWKWIAIIVGTLGVLGTGAYLGGKAIDRNNRD